MAGGKLPCVTSEWEERGLVVLLSPSRRCEDDCCRFVAPMVLCRELWWAIIDVVVDEPEEAHASITREIP
jgi:hypothetical protein